MQEALEVIQIGRSAVGQGAFKMVPNELVRVELGSIAWEPEDLKTRMLVQEGPDDLPLVGCTVVPQQHHRTAQMLEELPEELNHLGRLDVLVAVEPGVKRHAPSSRGNGKGRNGRYLVPASSTAEQRRLASWRPRSADAGDQQEPALVEENEGGSQPFSVFLYGATCTSSNVVWPPRSVPGRVSPVSDSSTPGSPKTATGGSGGTGRQTPSQLLPPRGVGSTGPWSIRNRKPLSRGSRSGTVVAAVSASWGGRGSVSLPGPSDLCPGPSRATDTPSSTNSRPWRRPAMGPILSSEAQWRDTGVSQAVGGFRLGACPYGDIFPITYA